MRTFSLSAVGADRPGIIAAVAERLVAHGVNVTDSQMGILRGFFAMTLLITAPDEVDEDALAADVHDVGETLRLDTVTLRAVPEAPAVLDEPTHVVSVHGADHPGILAAVTGSLAAAGVNVCDLRTRLTPDGVWVMVIHVATPQAADVEAIGAALHVVAEREGVGVSLHAAEADVMQVAVRDVLRYPDARLTAVAASPAPADIARIAQDLVDTMRSFPRCVGVAAPQLDEPVRMFAVDCTGHPKVPQAHGLLVLVDPVVVHAEGDARGREGCLSIPALTGDVHRPTAVVIEARDRAGAPLRIEAAGYEARVLLHELDHLDGILFLDRAVAVFPRKSYG